MHNSDDIQLIPSSGWTIQMFSLAKDWSWSINICIRSPPNEVHNRASKLIGTVIKCLFTNCVYKSLPVNHFRTEWIKLSLYCVWSHSKYSPQCWWLVVDTYLAVLHGSVNIHYWPPPLWWIFVDCTHQLGSLKVINKYYLPFSGRRGKNCMSILQFLTIFQYIAKSKGYILASVWYTLKQDLVHVFISVSLKVVDMYINFSE